MFRTPELSEGQWHEVFQALLGRAHDFALGAPDPIEEMSRVQTGRALAEVSEALFGTEVEPLILPDLSFVDHSPDARYATESDRLWDTGPRSAA